MLLLPAAQRRDELTFHLAKFLPYNARIALIVGLAALGVALQLLFELLWVGAALLLAASLLATVRGHSNVIDLSRVRGRDWNPCTMREFDRVVELHDETKQWDKAWVDITCARGFFALVVLLGGAVGVAFLLGDSPYGAMWLVDAAALILPHWITGIRTILKQDALIIKISMLRRIAQTFETCRNDNEEFRPMLEVGKVKEGDIPTDAKAMVHFHDTPPEFLGVQAQLAINSVQGADYPYFYCVVIAREAMGLPALVGRLGIEPPSGIVHELSREKGEMPVDVLVIRQFTTRKSGYHTRLTRALEIFLHAVDVGRQVTSEASG